MSVLVADRLERPSSALSRSDWRNLLLIVAGWLLCVLVFPPNHDFATTDDWECYQLVAGVLNGRGFQPPDYLGSTSIVHIAWGAMFANLFGLNYTSLTWAILVAALVGLLAFYLLLHELSFRPGLSVLGVAFLAFHPLYFSLAYSYMTDSTFLACLLLALLFYTKGLAALPSAAGNQLLAHIGSATSRAGDTNLLLGSLFASLAFLTRQFGLAVPIAAVLWLLWARRLTLRRLVATGLLPVIVGLGYFWWQSGFGRTVISQYQAAGVSSLLHDPLGSFLLRNATWLAYLPVVALVLPLLRPLPRHQLLLFGCWLMLTGLASYTLLTTDVRENSFVLVNARPSSDVTNTMRWLGVPLAAWLLTGYSVGLISWLRSLRRPPAARDFVYLFGLVMLVGTWLASTVTLPRYLLPLIPVLIVIGLRPFASTEVGRTTTRPAVVALWLVAALVATLVLLIHVDDYNYNNTRWQVGQHLLAQGVPAQQLDNGFAWSGFYLYQEARHKFGFIDYAPVGYWPPAMLLDPSYVVAPQEKTGYTGRYTVVARHPYFSPLSGFRDNTLLVLRRQE